MGQKLILVIWACCSSLCWATCPTRVGDKCLPPVLPTVCGTDDQTGDVELFGFWGDGSDYAHSSCRTLGTLGPTCGACFNSTPADTHIGDNIYGTCAVNTYPADPIEVNPTCNGLVSGSLWKTRFTGKC